MKSVLRRVALRVPPVARLYNFAMKQAGALGALTAQNAALATELAAAVQERDALELQLYVLRSDHQRAAVRNQDLSRALRAAEDQVSTIAKELAAVKAMVANQPVGVTPDDLSLLYAKLAGRMTLLSSEVARLRPAPAHGADCATLYLDLLERALAGMLSQDGPIAPGTESDSCDATMAQPTIGLARLRNLRVLAERVVQEGIPGDMLAVGVRHDGACLLMRGVLKAYENTERLVWVVNTFTDLPEANPAHDPADKTDKHASVHRQPVSSNEMRANFERHGLLDRQVKFLQGRINEPLATAPVDQLAILHLGCDIRSSTMQMLDALYDKIAPGGYVIVNDYSPSGRRQAVDDFRHRRGIEDNLNDVDGAAIYWRKQ